MTDQIDYLGECRQQYLDGLISLDEVAQKARHFISGEEIEKYLSEVAHSDVLRIVEELKVSAKGES